jgi:phage shock protein A
MSGQISRLTTVSHVLYDREVLELRQMNERLREEIEELKSKLAQRDSVIAQLSITAIRLMCALADST